MSHTVRPMPVGEQIDQRYMRADWPAQADQQHGGQQDGEKARKASSPGGHVRYPVQWPAARGRSGRKASGYPGAF